MLALKNQSWFDLQHIHGHRRLGTSQHNAIDQIANAVQRMAAAVNVNLLNGFPAHEGREHACQTEDMIKVTVSQQDMVQTFEANPGFQDLPLRALATIHHETKLVMFHDE